MSTYEGIQLLVGMMVIFGSGVASWVGVKVALAQMKQKQETHDKDIEEIKKRHDFDLEKLSKRFDRLEEKYFR